VWLSARSIATACSKYRSASSISLALGYADPSGFTHAFQRWSGMAPIEWRKREVLSA
jgi:AraC-like DNA-binding protein